LERSRTFDTASNSLLDRRNASLLAPQYARARQIVEYSLIALGMMKTSAAKRPDDQWKMSIDEAA
jgi:hypothetical protein